MLPRFGLKLILLGVVLAGCATQDVVVSSGKARFADYPDSLIKEVQAVCSRPAQTFSRPDRDSMECREYLPPKPTAAIILAYDGNPQDLPQLVVRFQTRADTPGYLVQNDVFLLVPQKQGAPLRIRQTDADLSRMLNALYTRAGGVPE